MSSLRSLGHWLGFVPAAGHITVTAINRDLRPLAEFIPGGVEGLGVTIQNSPIGLTRLDGAGTPKQTGQLGKNGTIAGHQGIGQLPDQDHSPQVEQPEDPATRQ